MPERYRINITDEALEHIRTIFEYISQHSRLNAAKVIEKLLNEIDDLGMMPGRFRVAGRSKGRGTPVHARVVRPYLVYYRIDEPGRTVFITAVRHGARKQPRKFD